MEDCNAMHFCWTISPLHRQKLILASTKVQPIWDFQKQIFGTPAIFRMVWSKSVYFQTGGVNLEWPWRKVPENLTHGWLTRCSAQPFMLRELTTKWDMHLPCCMTILLLKFPLLDLPRWYSTHSCRQACQWMENAREEEYCEMCCKSASSRYCSHWRRTCLLWDGPCKLSLHSHD